MLGVTPVRRSSTSLVSLPPSFCSSYCPLSLSVPAPGVSVTSNTGGGPAFQGAELVITCTVSVDLAVDTPFTVSLSWSSEPGEVLNGSNVTISETTESGHEFTSTVTISPVNISDSAQYTCTASVSPSGTVGVIASSENTDSINVSVEGELL